MTYEYRAPFRGALALAGCDYCGDDLGVHEWVTTNREGLTNLIISCDRGN
jgi:hypothetical protein